MPFVYDQTEIGWPEDGSDPLPPRADQFVYLPAPEYSGIDSPVRFSILPFGAPTRRTEPRPPAPPIVPAEAQHRSIQDILRDAASSIGEQEPERSFEESRRQARLLQEQRAQELFTVMVPALRALGVRRAYCRYDGGNDEGFAWLERYELDGGQPIAVDLLVQQLHGKFRDQLYAAGLLGRREGVTNAGEIASLKLTVGGTLCNEWAGLLLGEGFGSGEHSMYGAFTVDLDACTITDDPNADPVVENIEIAT
jgi:hypothetical protein